MRIVGIHACMHMYMHVQMNEEINSIFQYSHSKFVYGHQKFNQKLKCHPTVIHKIQDAK